MADVIEKRAARLVKFRKLQRERASREVQAARDAKAKAEAAVCAMEEAVREESERAQSTNGLAKSPEALQLALACVEASRGDLSVKQSVLKNADKHLGTKAKVLLATHKRVRQMEALKMQASQNTKKAEKKREQSEIDDLATNREARQ